jgi:hypothetical protein
MILARSYVIDKKILENVASSRAGYGLLKTKADGKPFVLTDSGKIKPEEKVDDGAFLAYTKDQPLQEGSFLSKVAHTIEAIEGGSFPVTPESCEFCDFAGLCRYVATPYSDEGAGYE